MQKILRKSVRNSNLIKVSGIQSRLYSNRTFAPTYPYNELPINENEYQKRPVYLDYQATTPVDPRVLDSMMPLYCNLYGNPHSRSHTYGWEAEVLVENARESIANLIGARSKEIIFTSGATESNNLAIKGVAQYLRGKKKHFITTQIEHKCVLASMRSLEEQGYEVTYLPVNEKGLVTPDQIEQAIRPDTAMVSIIYVNNEIGTIQPLEEISKICKKNNVLLHTDCAQAAGKINIDVDKLGIDLMSISSHKMYGPKGIGALYVRSKPKRVRIIPQIDGGGQERNLRSGTLAPPLIVGFGAAASIAREELDRDLTHVTKLANRLYNDVTKDLDDVILNGCKINRYPGNLNLSFAHVEGESLLMSLLNVAVSSGSACTSASLEPSYVLRAIGVNEELAHTSIRFGIGRFTTESEIDNVVTSVVKEVKRLREMSPLWELAQEGKGTEGLIWT